MSGARYHRTSKRPCVLACDVVFLLTSATTAMLNLPLEQHERARVESAIVAAHRAMNRSQRTAPMYLPPDWVETETEGLSDE